MAVSTSAQAASAAELAPLRAQIDEIDSQLVVLLAARAKVTAQVGQVKQQYALPLYVPERELALLNARRQQAEQLGVSAELVEERHKNSPLLLS